MRCVKCEECNKIYDFDIDDFCPKCGAFNQPPRASAVGADGSVVRPDGINEKNHAGSFVHAELHEENRERRRMGLSKSVRRAAFSKAGPSPRAAAPAGSRRTGQTHEPTQLLRVIFKVIAVIFLLNIISGFVNFFRYFLFDLLP